ncbi:MAG TPA: acyltransferase [Azonexus sp.]|nr:acyltransferase [Azonexus sp.]
MQTRTSPDNNFDLLRHIAASLVLWSHSFSLSASSRDPLAGTFIDGALGVNIFFAISGYLISESWFRRNDAQAFIEARLLRIMPALIASVLLCACVIGPLLTSASLGEYFADWRLRWFVAGNISMQWMGEELPYLFLDNPHPSVVNASLWTLPKEAAMYGAVLVVGFLCRWRRLSGAFVPIFAAAFAYATWRFIESAQSEHALTFLRVSRYFLAGAILGRLTFDARANAVWALALSAAMLALPDSRFVQAAVPPLALACGVLAVARMPMPQSIAGRWKVDLSYGLYVYGYPLQQVIFHFDKQLAGYGVFFIALCLTALLALASWLLLEKPALAQQGCLKAIAKNLRAALSATRSS